MKKKVLILVNHNVVIYNFRKELVERLVSDGYEVYLSCPMGNRIEELKSMGCKYVETDVDRHGINPFTDLKLIRHYKKIMREIKPDIVLSYTIKPNVYGGIATRMLKIPQIANITGLGTAVENPGVMQKFLVMLYKFAFKNVRKIFFQNEENMTFFEQKKIYTDRHELIPGSGVNLSQFVPSEYPNDNEINFLFISRVMKEKGIDYYLEAAKVVKNKYKNANFHICGFCEEEYKGRLQDFIDDLTVIYHGPINNVSEFLKDIHCVVHPTYYPEGMSNVLLESLACGRPIITTDRSGCREIVDDGINGYMIRQRNQEDLDYALEKFIKLDYNQKKSMGLAGRKKVEEQFDRQIVVNKYIETIRKEVK